MLFFRLNALNWIPLTQEKFEEECRKHEIIEPSFELIRYKATSQFTFVAEIKGGKKDLYIYSNTRGEGEATAEELQRLILQYKSSQIVKDQAKIIEDQAKKIEELEEKLKNGRE